MFSKFFAATVLCLALLISQPAFAAWGWFSCTIGEVGSSVNGFQVDVTSTDASFTGTKTLKFHTVVTDSTKKEIIATLLTAKANGSEVSVFFGTHNMFTLQGAVIK